MINLLPIAMQAISIIVPPEDFLYVEYSETETIINDIGVEIPAVKFEKTYSGIIQPVSDNKMYTQLGLDLAPNDYVVHCPELLKSMAETTLPGYIQWQNRVYDIVGSQNWYRQNKFTKCFIKENKSLRNNGIQNT